MHLLRTITALLLLCAAAPAAQRPQGDPGDSQAPMTFRVEVNYVEVDATATDGQGNLVLDLTRDDFQVLEDGRPQALTVFSRVDLPLERPDPPLFRAAAVEPDVRTNRREFDGRVFVLMLDDLHTSVQRTGRVRAAAAEFIEKHLGANDLAAVVHTSGARATAQEFTASRPLLLRAVNQFAGRKLPSSAVERIAASAARAQDPTGRSGRDPYELERAYKARSLLSALEGVAEFLHGVRGRRKSVVLFSEGIDYDVTNPIENRFGSDITGQMRAAIAAATQNNVSFYAIDPRGLAGFEDAIDIGSLPPDQPGAMTSLLADLRLSQDSLRTLAEETGGAAAINRNDYGEAFARIIRENSSYYILGYYSDNTRRDGRYRAVTVRVNRPGVQVRARKGYLAPRGNPAAVKSGAAPGTSPELREALASPLPVSGLTLSASAVPFRGGRGGSVLLVLELDGSRFEFVEKDGTLSSTVEVAVVPFDAAGNAQEGAHDSVSMTPRPATRDVIRERGLRVLRRLDLRPGRYQLRIGAREAGSGAAGSVMLDVEVPAFDRAPLTMSGLALTSASAAGVPTARADDQLKDVLPTPPTAARSFAQRDELTLFTEVYDHIRPPHRVEIRTSVTADDGTVVFTQTDERASQELTARGDAFGHRRAIPLANIAPGRYVLRVEARALVSDAPSASRELEFTVR